MSKTVGIFSGKGGAGKTTCALNLGLALQELGEKVILVDFDLRTANLGLHLGMYDYPTTIQDVLEKEISLLEAVSIHASGLRLIPSSIALSRSTYNLSKLKDAFKELNYLVVLDTPPGIGDMHAQLFDLCDEILVVTTPDMPSVTDAMKTIQFAMDQNKKSVSMIVNRVTGKHEIHARDIEEVCKVPVLGSIPDHRHFKESLHAHLPVVVSRPHSPPSVAFKKIASAVIGRPYQPPRFLFLRQFL